MMEYSKRIKWMKLVTLLAVMMLYGCGKGEPVTLTGPQQKYIGVWQYLSETRSEETRQVYNVMLAINSDSSAAYRKCYYSITQSQNGNSRHSSSSSVDLPDAVITELTRDHITLEQDVGFISLDFDLNITHSPYVENKYWYLEIDSIKLQKLNDVEIAQQTDWNCTASDS